MTAKKSASFLTELFDIFHVSCFAALPIIITWWQGRTYYLPKQTLPAIAVAECIGLVLFILFNLLVKNRAKAAILTSLLWIAFCVYKPFSSLDIFHFIHGAQTDLIALGTYLIFLAFALVFCATDQINSFLPRGASSYQSFSRNLTIVSCLLFILNAFPLAVYQFQMYQIADRCKQQLSSDVPVQELLGAKKPDIYYLIVDDFANSQTLANDFAYDNSSSLINPLRAMGFFVLKNARSNYGRTHFSIGSSLNMHPVLPQILGMSFDGDRVLSELIDDNIVARTLKKSGYKFFNISSASSATDFMFSADRNYNYNLFNDFSFSLMMLTPLSATLKLWQFPKIIDDWYVESKMRPEQCIDAVTKIPGPKFVLIHSEFVHPPMLLDEAGHRLPISPLGANDDGTASQYLSQLKYAEPIILNWIQKIINQPGEKPVVIVQSDHGPWYPQESSEKYYTERMTILNAFFFPSGAYKDLYETITPINSFRVVFNQLSKDRLPLLPDHSWCSTDKLNAYDLKNVDKFLTSNRLTGIKSEVRIDSK